MFRSDDPFSLFGPSSTGDDSASTYETLGFFSNFFGDTQTAKTEYEIAGVEHMIHGEPAAGALDFMIAASLNTSQSQQQYRYNSSSSSCRASSPPSPLPPPPPRINQQDLKAIEEVFLRAKQTATLEPEPGDEADQKDSPRLITAIDALRSEVKQRATDKSINPEVAMNAGEATITFINSMKSANSQEEQTNAIEQYRNDLNPSILGDVILYGLISAIIVAVVAFFGFAAAPLTIAYTATGGAAAGGLFSWATARTKINKGEEVINEAKASYHI